jgi:hypothetical protein
MATGPNYTAHIRFSEGKSYTVIGDAVTAKLVPGVWTQVNLSATVQTTGDQMILSAYTLTQIGGATGLTWDDCSVTTPVL